MKSPPSIKIEVFEIERGPEGFLQSEERKVKVIYPDGNESDYFNLSSVKRDRLDAVAIIPYFIKHDRYYIYLRSAVRASLGFRDYSDSKLLEESDVGNQWELAAGLVESSEIGMTGLQSACARELAEEVGFNIDPDRFKLLGKRIFPAPSMCGERIFFFTTEVVPAMRFTPTCDGHPLEEQGEVIVMELGDAIDCVLQGYFPDAKTEIGIMRFAHRYLRKSFED